MHQWSVQCSRSLATMRSGRLGWPKKRAWGTTGSSTGAISIKRWRGTTSWAETGCSIGAAGQRSDGPVAASSAGARGRAATRWRLRHRRRWPDDDVWRAADRQFRAWRLSRGRAVSDLSRRDAARSRPVSVAGSCAAAGHAGGRLHLQIAGSPGDLARPSTTRLW